MTKKSAKVLVVDQQNKLLNYLGHDIPSHISVKKAFLMLMTNKADVLKFSGKFWRTSNGQKMEIPQIIRLLAYDYPNENDDAKFSRLNVFLRDKFTDQYTGKVYKTAKAAACLNLEHVIPQSQGGPTGWENIITTHHTTNTRRGNMPLNDFIAQNNDICYPRVPYTPTVGEILTKAAFFKPSWVDDNILDFLYWNVELEQKNRQTILDAQAKRSMRKAPIPKTA